MPTINVNITVKELLDRHPEALGVFLERNLGCIGCPTEAYHTLADVARIHGCPPEKLLAVLRKAIQKKCAP